MHFSGLAALPVEVDLLVRAAGDAHPPAAALVLVDQDDAVLLALVDRPARAGRHARRVQAVLAEARQVHHEGVLVLTVDVRLDLVEVLVLAPLGELGAEDLLPVRAPLDLLHALPGDQRARARHRLVLGLGRGMQVLVIEVERFVVVVDLGQVGLAKMFASTRNLPPMRGRIEPSAARTQPPFHFSWFPIPSGSRSRAWSRRC